MLLMSHTWGTGGAETNRIAEPPAWGPIREGIGIAIDHHKRRSTVQTIRVQNQIVKLFTIKSKPRNRRQTLTIK